MAKLHFVRRSRNNYRKERIKKGDSYYFWIGPKPRIRGKRGVKFRSRTKPPRSAYATRSEFIGAMMDLEDRFLEDGDGLRDAATEVRSLGEECQSKFDSVRGAFPNGSPTADLLESRIQACERIANELEAAAEQITDDSTEEEIREIIESVNWEYE